MTHVIQASTIDQALSQGLEYLARAGIDMDSRNGKVKVAPGPVITEYLKPRNRVLLNPLRDANPFFHMFESLWMLAGRNDVEFVKHYAKQAGEYTDDGVTVPGAYGHRWRHAFGYDQLDVIITELKKNPDSRRCVLSMWNAWADEGCANNVGDLHTAINGGKDVPCNTQAYFDTIGGKLNMTVTNRSNDIIWGCYGANAVHFSMLHEYVALSANMELGVYRQFSNNYHMYVDRPDVLRLFNVATEHVGYSLGKPKANLAVHAYDRESCGIEPEMLFDQDEGQSAFDKDLSNFMKEWDKHRNDKLLSDLAIMYEFETKFFNSIVKPMYNTHVLYKRSADSVCLAIGIASSIKADDWRIATMEWLQRRVK